MKPRKKKGRPPKNPSIPNHRSTLPNPSYSPDDVDDDDRKEKKVKLVVRLPPFDQDTRPPQKRPHDDDVSPSDSDSESEDLDAKKRKINAVDAGSDDAASLQEKNAWKATGSGPTTPLPDKKLLVFILDRLQKKDTHGVFSEPVDLNELPDYLDYVEKPMDFGTIRKKLDGRDYKYLEELEADVFLLCSNAMTYNASNTVFYRQARSIQELAKRDLQNLKHEGENGEPQPKVVRRGRPPSNKNQKKSQETSPANRAGTELSSDATLPGAEDNKATGSNTYNLRKAPPLNRFRSSNPYISAYHSRNDDNNNSQSSGGWNDEFPASILRADMKYGKKHFTVDENRRDTYKLSHSTPSASNLTIFSTSTEDTPSLVPVGLQDPISYARSLARYAADLGPVAWKIASKRIESVLPPGVPYGPVWVGDDAPASQPFSFSSNSSAGDGNPNKPMTPPTSDLSSAIVHDSTEGVMEAVRKLNSQNQVGIHSNAADSASWRAMSFPVQQKPAVYHHQSQRNGFSWETASVGSGMHAAAAVTMAGQCSSMTEPASRNEHLPCSSSHAFEEDHSLELRNLQSRGGYGHHPNPTIPMEGRGKAKASSADYHYYSGQAWNLHQRQQQQQQRGGGYISSSSVVPPDLNINIVGVPVPVPVPGGSSSPTSSHHHQPDLALQL